MTHSYTPYGWLQPKPVPLLDTPEGKADLKLILNTCYEAILKCDDPAVRWHAAHLIQAIGPLKGTLQ